MNYNYNNAGLMNQLYRQKENIENMITQYTQGLGLNTQPPVQNIINTTGTTSDTDVRYVKPGEDISNLIISKKTLFIDEDNSKISIKEVDGNISKVYNIIVPKDEKDIKIEKLEKKIKELEERLDDKHAEHTVTDATIKSTTASANKSTKSATITTF
jgi:hypothetical protein